MPLSLALRMQREDRSKQAARWRALFRFDKAKIAPEIAFRNTIGIVLPLFAGAALGNPSAGVVGALGALNVAYSDSRDPYIARARRMLLATVLVGLAVTLGALSGRNDVIAVAAAALWAFGAGMMVLFGLQAGNLGVTTLVTLVVFAARRLTPLVAVETGLVALAGGVLQTLLAIAFWPVNRYEPERRIIGSLYHSLAGLAVSSAGQGGAPPGAVQLTETDRTLASLSQDRQSEAQRYIFLVNQAERIRLSLLTLRRLLHRIERDPAGAVAAAVMREILAASSSALDQSGRAVVSMTAISLDRFQNAADEFRKLSWQSPSSFLSATIRDANHQLDALAGQLRTVRAVASAVTEHKAAPRIHGAAPAYSANPQARLAAVRANLSFQSTAFRHALRLAVCVCLGEALGHVLRFQRTYWLTMTIAIVLRPDFAATYVRGILRIAGTMVGLLLATVLFHFLPAGRTTEVALLTVFAFLLRWIGPANYGVFVIVVSAFIVMLLAVTGVAPADAITARAINTLIGGAIALTAYRIWPTWEWTRAGPVMASLLEAHKSYFRAVIDAYISGTSADEERNRARMKARLARSNAEALIDRIAAEPGSTIEHSTLLGGMLASSHNFVRAVMALESGLYFNRPERVRQATIDFAGKVDTTLHAVADSLRSSNPPPRLPDLREAHNAILASANAAASQYTLINTETDRMTTSLNTLSEQAAKWLRQS